MADNTKIWNPGFRVLDDSGDPASGAVIKFFVAGTSTPLTVYSDEDLSANASTTVTCDSSGVPQISSTDVVMYTGTADYKVEIENSAGSTLIEVDNLSGALDTSGFLTTATAWSTPVLSKTSAYTATTSDLGKTILVDATSGGFDLTLPSAASVGDGGRLTVIKTTDANVVTVVPDGSETISGRTSICLVDGFRTHGLISDGSNWHQDIFYEGGPHRGKPAFATLDFLATPPVSPTAGDLYVLEASPTGAWSTFAEHDIVEYDGISAWRNFTPNEGWHTFDKDTNEDFVFTGSEWQELSETLATSNIVDTTDAAVATFTTQVPLDDTIPQITEGDSAISGAITLNVSSHRVQIHCAGWISANANTQAVISVYRNSVVDAIHSMVVETANGDYVAFAFAHIDTPALSTEVTYSVRIGPVGANTITLNGAGGARMLGGAASLELILAELPA